MGLPRFKSQMTTSYNSTSPPTLASVAGNPNIFLILSAKAVCSAYIWAT
jgi:hypothetical protein